MLAHMDYDVQGKWDRALILLGMAGAFRSSELVAISVGDLTFTVQGLCQPGDCRAGSAAGVSGAVQSLQDRTHG